MLSKNQIFNILSLLFISITISSCGSGNTQGTGKVEIGITDAPIDSAEAVVIHFTKAELHGPDGTSSFEVIDPVNEQPGRSIDLLQLQGGMWTGLFTHEVTAGQYSWIRLTMDMTQSYIQINGQQYALRCTSCEKSGYRINRSFNVVTGGTMALMLDFDLRKSITDPSSGLDYILRPTVRVVETAASGSIKGEIDPNIITALGGFTGCSIYAFTGNDAVLDDVYIPVDMLVSSEQHNPVSTANVVYENNVYQYTLSFLPAGDYTVALTCNADIDSAATDDTLVFSEPVNVSVISGTSSGGNIYL